MARVKVLKEWRSGWILYGAEEVTVAAEPAGDYVVPMCLPCFKQHPGRVGPHANAYYNSTIVSCVCRRLPRFSSKIYPQRPGGREALESAFMAMGVDPLTATLRASLYAPALAHRMRTRAWAKMDRDHRNRRRKERKRGF